MKHHKVTFPVFLSLIFFGTNALSNETPYEWYDTFKQPIPRPQLIAAQSRDNGIFQNLNIPAILAILKFELKFGTWPKVESQTRKELLQILEDSGLEIIFTGKQSKMVHSAGGQTINKNKILINSEGFLRRGAPKSPLELASIILHEMGHVHYLRYHYFPYYLKNQTVESFPNLVESQLPKRYFTGDMVNLMNSYIEDNENVAGSWRFGRVAGPFLCKISLTEKVGKHGKIIKSCHKNESFWKFQDKQLLFFNAEGRMTTKFTQKSPNLWEGPYYQTKDVPLPGITHYIKR